MLSAILLISEPRPHRHHHDKHECPELSYVDNRLLGVQLVKNDMTKAIMFDRYGHVQEPDDMLYKKKCAYLQGKL